jgi:hypothetical protein
MTRAPYRWGQPRPTHCVRGHELTTENVRVDINDTGRSNRRCRECERAVGRARKARERAQRKTA